MYIKRAVYIDHVSYVIKVYNQVFVGASDTIRSKELYDQHDLEMRIKIKSYRGDNGLYNSNTLQQDLLKRYQKISISGVDSHYQNRVAERVIQTIVSSAPTIMIHQALM